MRKRMTAALLGLVLAVSLLVVPAGAAGTTQFSDVSDKSTSTAIEPLRLMGVLDGYSNGTFRPDGKLTRAQFCKMVTYVMNASNELGMYRTVTVFPDVKPSHWAASYINLAAKGKAVIAGYPDGSFCPDRTVTVGQAVTILVRLLGYKDDEVGGVWPEGYMAVAVSAGLTDGLQVSSGAALTRGQAAKLFLNLLAAEKKDGGTLYTLSEETELVSLDGGTGQLKTLDGSYTMVNPVSSTSLIGRRGQVVTVGDRALTFLPASAGNGGVSDAAVIVYSDRSAAGFETLAGNTSYQIYKNGTLASRGDLRKYDVATYYAATNSILVCDTRVTAYYESCEPSPSAPNKIQVLGGTELHVLPTAMDSLARFKPGQQMTLLLTADGQVAGAVEPSGSGTRSNAVGVVSESGEIQLLCGSGTIPLAMKTTEEKYLGQVVRLSAAAKDKINLTVLSSVVRGDLDADARTLGSKQLAENVMVFENGTQTSLSQLNGLIRESQIRYARTNWAGEVDLIVLARSADELYGRVFRETDTVPVYDDAGNQIGEEKNERIGVEYGNGQRTKAYNGKYDVRTGDFVAVKLNRGQTGFAQVVKLTELENVSVNSWIGKTAVTFGGRTYEVPSNVQCYNVDSREWVTLDQALAYSNTADLHIRDGVVRVVEVRHTA